MLHALTIIITSTTLALTTPEAAASQRADSAAANGDPAKATKAEEPSRPQASTRQTSKATSTPQFAFHKIETKLIAATNHARTQYGLPPLTVDYGLMRSARRHTAWMTHARTLQHGHANVAENIAMGQHSVSAAMHSWMTSPGHRANILNGSYRRIGVAAYRTPEGTIYWCQQFTW